MMKSVRKFFLCCGLAASTLPVSAADGPTDSGIALWPVAGTIVYSLLGLAILLIAFKIFDVFTPYNLHKELAEDQNTAIGVMMAGVFIALAIIIAASIT